LKNSKLFPQLTIKLNCLQNNATQNVWLLFEVQQKHLNRIIFALKGWQCSSSHQKDAIPFKQDIVLNLKNKYLVDSLLTRNYVFVMSMKKTIS